MVFPHVTIFYTLPTVTPTHPSAHVLDTGFWYSHAQYIDAVIMCPNLSKILTIDTSELTCEGKIGDVFCEFRLGFMFYFGILPKGPYPPCLRMADRALLAGYPPLQSLLCCVKYHNILDHIIMALYCINNCPYSKVHGANMGPIGPRWAPCWPHGLCYLGLVQWQCYGMMSKVDQLSVFHWRRKLIILHPDELL